MSAQVNSVARRADSYAPVHQLVRHAIYEKASDNNFTVLIRTPCDSGLPSWGQFCNFTIREKPIRVLENYIQFTIEAPTFAYSTPSGDIQMSKFIPAPFFFERCDILTNGQVQQTRYDENIFLETQFYPESASDRISKNAMMGSSVFDTASVRDGLLRAGHLTFYVPLNDFLTQSKGHTCILEAGHEVQFRFKLRNLADVSTNINAGRILQMQLITKANHLNELEAQRERVSLSACVPRKFADIQVQTAQLTTGKSSTTVQLTSITGFCGFMYFFVRPIGSIDEGTYNFQPIASWELVSSAGQNIVGGQPITADDNAYLIAPMADMLDSTILTDSRQIITPPSYSNVYVYPFTDNARDCVLYGNFSNGGRRFTGSERVNITFPSALSTDVDIRIYFVVEGIIDQGRMSFTKYTR